MKTSRAASKRFKITGSGKVLVQSRGLRHNLEHKTAKRKRTLDGVVSLSAASTPHALRMLGKR